MAVASGVIYGKATQSVQDFSDGNAVVKDKNLLGGEPVFRGTRVPFKALTDYLEGGETLDEFLEQYPTVSRQLAIEALEEARAMLESQL